MGENGVCCYCLTSTTTNTISHTMTYTILAYTIVIIAAIGLLSNFLFIFFMDENDKLNEDISKCPYLNGEKDGL